MIVTIAYITLVIMMFRLFLGMLAEYLLEKEEYKKEQKYLYGSKISHPIPIPTFTYGCGGPAGESLSGCYDNTSWVTYNLEKGK